MSNKIKVRKRNNRLEDFQVDKIHRVLEWGTEGYEDVSISEIELNANLSFYDGISTEDIHNLLIRSANNLISEEHPNYQYVAARLLLFWVRKKVWGSDIPPKLFDHINKNVRRGIYDNFILEQFTENEIHKIEKIINHKRDYDFTYAGLQQLVDKYLCQDRTTGELYETPQFAYILIAMTLFAKYSVEERMGYIKKCYDYISKFKINLPTPIMAGVRTPIRQYASCCLVDIGDSMSSIMASCTSVAYMSSRRAGIGISASRIRPIGSPIRQSEVIHTGVIPFLKVFEATVKSCSQNGIRGSSATCHMPFWHYEIEDIIVLKNNAGSAENRVRKLDYSISFSKLAYERLINDDYITLFSPHEAKGLYDVFGLPEFDELYKKYEQDDLLKFKKRIKAKTFFELFTRERIETGRIYIFNIDHANTHGSWLEQVTMSNLCQEITQPTTPQKHIDDQDAEIGICILSAINLLEVNVEELEPVCDITVRLLDAVIDHQTYPIKAAENFTINRRSLGIGITNLAALLAKNKVSYEDEKSWYIVDEWMEAIQYSLLKASCNLSKEKGACNKFNLTKYSQGILPIDTYNKNVNNIVKRQYNFDWDELRKNILKYGLRNSTLTAIMPVESSSVIQNSTNGIEPPRSLLSIKKSKKGNLKQIVPNFYHYRNYYTKAFDMTNNIGILNIAAVIQKWIDMSISTNVYYDYEKFEGKEVPMSVLIKEQLYAYKMGIKNIYYTNTTDSNKASVDADNSDNVQCEGGACTL